MACLYITPYSNLGTPYSRLGPPYGIFLTRWTLGFTAEPLFSRAVSIGLCIAVEV